MSANRKIAYAAGIACAIIWGAAFPVVKPSLEFVTPYQFLFLRFIIAGFLMTPLIIWHLLKRSFPFHKLGIILGLEFLSMTVLAIIYVGLEQTEAIQASLLLNTKPIFMILAGILFLKEIEERHELFGLVMAVIGTTLIIFAPIIYGTDGQVGHISNWGNALIMLSVFLDVFKLICVKKFYGELDKFLVVSISSVIGFFYFGLICAATGTLPALSVMTQPSVALAVLYMGTLGSVLAFTFHLISYSRIEASEASLFEYLNPLVYLPLGVFWLKETLLPPQIIGICIIAIGVYLAQRRQKTSISQHLKSRLMGQPHPHPAIETVKS